MIEKLSTSSLFFYYLFYFFRLFNVLESDYMADISAEITAFRNAVYGEDVRSAMISLANKLNSSIGGYETSINTDFENFKNTVNTNITNFENTVNTAIADIDPEIQKILDNIYDNDDVSFQELTVDMVGKYVHSPSERIAAYEPLRVSTKIPVKANDVLVLRVSANELMYVVSYYIDSIHYEGILVGHGGSDYNYMCVLPHDGDIVISYRVDNNIPTQYKIITNLMNQNIHDDIKNNTTFVNNLSRVFEKRTGPNLFNKYTDVWENTYLKTSTSELIHSETGAISKPIPAKPNTIYYLFRSLPEDATYTPTSMNRFIFALDENFNAIPIKRFNGTESFIGSLSYGFKTPDNENVKYISFELRKPIDDSTSQSVDINSVRLYEAIIHPSSDNISSNYYSKEDQLTSQHEDFINDLYNRSSKDAPINLFNKNRIIKEWYIDGSTMLPFYNNNDDGSVRNNYIASDYIEVKPNTVYYIYRGISVTAYNGIVCIKEDGTSELPINTSTNEQYTNIYALPRNGTIKTTADTKYLCFNIGFGEAKIFDVDIIGLYEGSSYPGYIPHSKFRLSYDNLPADINQHETTIDKHITIANSDKIGFFSNSYLNGYTIRTHHAIDNLGMYSDYIMYNYSKSGDDVLESLVRINNNDTWLGDVPIQEQHLTYGLLAMCTNDGALYNASSDTYYQNCKKLCDALRAMGVIPMLATEHRVFGFCYGMMRLAEQEHYEFIDWGREASAYGMFDPFWYNHHPATRSAWVWSNGLKPLFDRLPRPKQSIKIFRKRPNASSTIANLIYNNVYERAERFVEIYNGYSCLTKATEKYFDRIDTGNTSYETVKSEYQTLHKKTGSINLGTHALIEGILPYTRDKLNMLKININATGVSNAYIKKDLALSNMFSPNRYVAFGITSGANLLSPNDTFTVTGGVFNDNILGTYTVSQVINNAIVITTTSSTGKTTSGTDNPTTNISGLVLKGSYDYPNADYVSRFEDPLAEWTALTFDETIDLNSYIATCVDYDKVSILLVGTNITLSDISFDCSGTNEKERYLTKTQAQYKKGTSVLTNTLLDDGTAWSGINSVPKYTPVASTVNTSTTEPYPTGITTVRVLQSGDSITQNIITTNLNNAYHSQKIQLRVIARYFPTYVDSDSDWSNSEIVEGSYDCSLLSAQLGNQAKFVQFHVGAFWHEYICDITYDGQTSLKLTCDSKSVQIARVEFDLIED